MTSEIIRSPLEALTKALEKKLRLRLVYTDRPEAIAEDDYGYHLVASEDITSSLLTRGFHLISCDEGFIVISRTPLVHYVKILDYLFADITGCESKRKKETNDAIPYSAKSDVLRRMIRLPPGSHFSNPYRTVTSYYSFMQMWYGLNSKIADIKRYTFIDATAGCGGDSLRFAQNAAGVIAIEKSNLLYRCNEANYMTMVSCGLITPGNYRLINGDHSRYVFKDTARGVFDEPLDIPPNSILYIDPDWKSSSDSNFEGVVFNSDDDKFAGIPVGRLREHIHPNIKYIIFKTTLTSKITNFFEIPILNMEHTQSYKIVVVEGNAAVRRSSSSIKSASSRPRK